MSKVFILFVSGEFLRRERTRREVGGAFDGCAIAGFACGVGHKIDWAGDGGRGVRVGNCARVLTIEIQTLHELVQRQRTLGIATLYSGSAWVGSAQERHGDRLLLACSKLSRQCSVLDLLYLSKALLSLFTSTSSHLPLHNLSLTAYDLLPASSSRANGWPHGARAGQPTSARAPVTMNDPLTDGLRITYHL